MKRLPKIEAIIYEALESAPRHLLSNSNDDRALLIVLALREAGYEIVPRDTKIE